MAGRLQMVGGVTTPSVIEAGSNRLLAFGGTSYGYDANGNTTTVNGTPRYHYNAFNRMDSVAGASFYVNPEGQRLRKTGSAGTHYFAPDQSNALLAEHDGVWRDYVWLNGRLVGVVLGGAVYPIHADQTGRPQAITNASSQAVVWASKNDAFDRNTTYNAWGNSFNIGFPGQYWDVESTLWHNGFRDYDYRTGRYVQSDPIGLAGGVNTYTYVDGNPVDGIDPLGLTRWKGGVLAGGAGGAVGAQGALLSVTSECQGGKMVFANIALGGSSFGLGTKIPVSLSSSPVEFEDGRSLPDPKVFEGSYLQTSTLDFAIGIGFGLGKMRVGEAVSEYGADLEFGFNISDFSTSYGVSNLINSSELKCGCGK